ncbi:MAG: hypothetical protein WC683_13570 [bacterium]
MLEHPEFAWLLGIVVGLFFSILGVQLWNVLSLPKLIEKAVAKCQETAGKLHGLEDKATELRFKRNEKRLDEHDDTLRDYGTRITEVEKAVLP